MKNLSPKSLSLYSGTNAGFSLVEVLISILMIAGFLATAMQALISATAIKVKAEEISEATAWMQEDLEAVKFEAFQLGYVDSDVPPDNIPDIHDPAALNVDDCQPSVPSGFADDLEGVLTDGSLEHRKNRQVKISSIGDREYELRRSLTSNFHTLKIEYDVINPRNGEIISELYSEVIPEVALYCEET